MTNLWNDIRYALRQLRKAPGFTIAVIALLGLGIGATTAVFSLVDTILLKPLPYPHADRIMMLWGVPPKGVNLGVTQLAWGSQAFHAMQGESKTFQSLGAFQSASFNLTGTGEPALVEGMRVSAGFFPALGVRPLRGRIFTSNEDQPDHEHEVLLGYQLWQDRFHGDPAIVGRGIDLNGASYTVLGIMPPDFVFPHANEMPENFQFPREAQLWVPAALPAVPRPFEPQELAVVARLQPGVTQQQAQAEMDVFASHMDRQFPRGKGWYNSRVTPLMRQIAGDTRQPLLLMLGAVSVVLLIVCSNVASLLLTRSMSRRKEFTLRAALGAARSRILRQLLTESLLLAVTGGAMGIAIAEAGIWFLKIFGPPGIPRLQETSLDFRVVAFAAGVTLITGIFFGVAPALGAMRVNLVEALKEGGQRAGDGAARSRLRNALVVSEIALALVLIIASGLLIQTFRHLLRADAGFKAQHALTFEISVPGSKYPDPMHIVQLYQKIIPQLQSVPGVQAAAIAEAVPMGGSPDGTSIRLPDHPVINGKQLPFADYTIVSPDYFSAVGTPVLRGRSFLETDTANSPAVTVINAAMARKYWPGQDAIGKQVIVPAQHAPMTVVGIVENVKHVSRREAASPEMYVPYTQDVWPSMAIMQAVLRTKGDPTSVIGGVRAAIGKLDPDLPVAKVTTLVTLTDASMAQPRFSMLVLGFFGTVALLLAAVGIYGVIAYSVMQRTQEIGIRMALGAQRTNVFAMVLGQGLRLAGCGIAVGLVAALGVSHLLASFLYGVKGTDPLTFAGLSIFLIGVALLACYIPARRAASIDPMQALRSE